MKIKRRELVRFFRAGYSIGLRPNTGKFQYALHKNLKAIRILQRDVDAECRSEIYEIYLAETRSYMTKMANKNPDGSPCMVNDPITGAPISFDFPEDKKPEIDKELSLIEERHKDAIEDMKLKSAKHQERLEEEIVFDFHQISISDIDSITGQEMENIKEMIKDF